MVHIGLTENPAAFRKWILAGPEQARVLRERGKGIRSKITSNNKVPGNWRDFLRDEGNKQELFGFLSQKIEAFDYPKGK